MRRGTAIVLAVSMMVLGALPGLAREAGTDDGRAGDRAAVDVVDRSPERPMDRDIDRRTDARPVDPVPVDVVDRPVDEVRDREIDRHRCVDFVTDRRCINDRHPHVNLRHLIQRLINAGEWEKLFRLLHRLGII